MNADYISLNVPVSSEDLTHYGILGMKWGVRRYQNYDGTYTQQGLARFKKAEGNYSSADKAYRQAKRHGSEADIRKAERGRNRAKSNLEKSYRSLKDDNRADKGHELVKKHLGTYEINAKDLKTSAATTAIDLGSTFVLHRLTKTGKIPMKTAMAAGAIIGAGTAAVSLYSSYKTNENLKNIQMYRGRKRRERNSK